MLFFLALFASTTAYSQQQTITKYFDSLWGQVSSADLAYYITTFTKAGNLYDVKSYWTKSKKLYAKSTYADTSFFEPRGNQVKYFENGIVQDSIWYDNIGKKVDYYRYYPSGKLLVHGGFDAKTGKDFSEAYDENGTLIPGYIFEVEASFPSGLEGWANYLSKHLNTQVPIKNKAPKGSYQIIAEFIIDSKGRVVDVTTENDPGYGMKEEVIRVISASPKWNPCISENKPINAYRRQPLTIQVL